ncbi:MAG: helix-turn-helix transcriptional regulator [Bdellovibrionota bacterium]
MHAFLSLNMRQKLSVFLILVLAMALWVIDAIDDLSHGSDATHIATEGIILAIIAFWVITITLRYFTTNRQNIQIRSDLAAVRKDLENYRRETAHLAKGLGLKIDEQLEKWQMTKAEKEVALLVLKGFSNKEISDIRGTAEKTTIQQVSAIYQKCGLHNRAEFAAFFLEDLLLPQ